MKIPEIANSGRPAGTVEADRAAGLPARGVTLLPLIAAIFFMVSGGPYGLEELVQKAGYSRALLILVITPLVWSLPTALMVGELASAAPAEGGYYVWVRRALGAFWGFQEAWLSLVASIFDMAIYPTLFMLYLARLWPGLAGGPALLFLGWAMIAACAAWNIGGARAVGRGSMVMMLALLGPFLVMSAYAWLHSSVPLAARANGGADLLGGMVIAMWNYMGWDNASTIAGEVQRPQRNYPRALLGAVALVACAYLMPVAAAARAGIDPAGWSTGAWVEVAGAIVGPAGGAAVGIGGMLCGIGIFNALMLSYSRLPLVLAEDGFLPKVFARRHSKTGAPWVAIIALGVAWGACLGLGFERLVLLDVLLFGLSLLLEFIALAVLRVREPHLPRPFRVPGGVFGAAALGVGPLAVIVIALVRNHSEHIWGVSALLLGMLVVAAGPVLYWLASRRQKTEGGKQKADR